jgi:TrpR-related protein YerC/YecD
MEFTPRLKNDQTDLLMKALLTLTSPEEAHRFCEDVMTIKELESIAQRLEVAVMLNRKATYQEIAEQTGASTATISRVNRCLHYGADGYTYVLSQLDKEV